MKRRGLGLALALALLLTACKGAEQPQITHWYGTGSYTTGVYDDPMFNWNPSNR